jgi:hypothetical protein
MAWPCRMVAEKGPKQTGDMWYTPAMLTGEHAGWYLGFHLSNEYKRDWLGKRPPLWVCLPGNWWFCVDSQTTDGAGQGWTVTGEPPKITVSPSINMVGLYHGWLRDGVLSDDVEGRTYPTPEGGEGAGDG